MVCTRLGTLVVVIASASAVSFAQPQSPPASGPAHNTFVLTGCLVAPVKETMPFTLSNASPVGQAPPPAPGGSSVPGTEAEKPTYELQPVSGVNQQGADAAELQPHVGQRVEVTVRPIEQLAPPAATAGTSVAPKVDSPVERKPQRFTVTAVKRASGSCP